MKLIEFFKDDKWRIDENSEKLYVYYFNKIPNNFRISQTDGIELLKELLEIRSQNNYILLGVIALNMFFIKK